MCVSVVEPFPLEALKDLLGHDKDHTNLPLVVLFAKSFAWDILGIKSSHKVGQNLAKEDGTMPAVPEHYDQSSAEDATKVDDPPLTGPEPRQRFKNIPTRYFEDFEPHIVKAQVQLRLKLNARHGRSLRKTTDFCRKHDDAP